MSVPNTEAVRDWANAKFEEKVEGKGLSTNDYTNEDKALVDKIPVEMKATSEVSGIKSGILEGSADGKIISISAKAAAHKSKNLIYQNNDYITYNGITVHPLGDGRFSVKGTNTSSSSTAYPRVPGGNALQLKAGVTYTFSGLLSDLATGLRYYVYDNKNDKQLGNNLTKANTQNTFTVATDTDNVHLYIAVPPSVSIDIIIEPMLVEGTEISEFEPHGLIAPSDEIKTESKNLLNVMIADDKKENGISWTKNNDGSVTAIGKATQVSSFNPWVILPKGKYIITGCPKNGTINTYCQRIAFGVIDTASAWEYGDGVEINLNEETKVYVSQQIRDTDMSANHTFYPMIRKSGIGDATFVKGQHSSINLNKIIASFSPNSLSGYENEVVVYDDYTGEYIEKSGFYQFTGIDEGWTADYLGTATQRFSTTITKLGSKLKRGWTRGTTKMICSDAEYVIGYHEFGTLTVQGEYVIFGDTSKHFASLDEFLTWIKNTKPTIIYDYNEPIVTQLAKDQIDAILKLSTFDDVTLINSEMSIDVKYYSGSNIGGAVAKVNKILNNATNVVNVLNNIKSAELTDSANGHISAISLYGATHKSKNLFNNIFTSKTVGTITYTVNEDKSVSVTGATTSAGSAVVVGTVKLPKGTYKVFGCPSGGSASTYRLRIGKGADASYLNQDVGNGAIITLDSEETITLGINVEVNTTTNTVFKPMITTDTSLTYDDYEPYGLIIPSGKVESRNINVFSHQNANFKRGYYLDGTGAEVSGGGYCYTQNYLRIKANTSYTLKPLEIVSGSSSRRAISFYDKDKQFISRNLLAENWGTDVVSTFTTPQNTCYIRVNCAVEYYDSPSKYDFSIIETSMYDGYVKGQHSSISTKDIIANFDLVEVNGLRNEIHVFADGTGEKIERTKKVKASNLSWEYVAGGNRIRTYLNDAKLTTDFSVSQGLTSILDFVAGNTLYNSNITGYAMYYEAGKNQLYTKVIDSNGNPMTDVSAFLAQYGNMDIVYELATPTITPLTASEVSAFLELMTYSDYTSIESDAEIDIEYYANSEIGQTVADVDSKVNAVSSDFEIKEQTLTNGIYVAKSGRVCELILESSSPITAGENVVIATIPEGFRPNKHISFVESFGNKRIIVAQNGNVTCSTALSGANIRGIATYLTNE